ncbi:MAG: hypothetical protein R3282_05060 [Rhodothermales bacterium]|nr:hypothetical protein [Rhodothermales bacterium]
MAQSSIRQLPWARIFVESLAIVASILLAFLIDAWWDASRDRIEERAILADLRSELSSNVEVARRVAINHSVYGERMLRLETMTEDEARTMPPDSAQSYLVLGYAWPTFDPRTGTVDGVMSSGRIEVISDPEIRRLLGDWRGRLNDVREEADLVTRGAERFLVRLTEQGPLPDGDVEVSNDRLLSVLRSEELMGLARAKVWYGNMYSGELIRHAEFAEGILAVIDGQN